MFIEPRGVKPCCSYAIPYQGSVQDWLHSSSLQRLQQNISTAVVDRGCVDCIKNEKINGFSTRTNAVKDYPQPVYSTKIDYVDYRSRNICNFKCRSCEPFFSNGIAQEAKNHPELQAFYTIPTSKTADISTQDKDWVVDNLFQIKRLMFTGGEPTKIPEVREIIDIIRRSNNRDISVMLTSNASFTDPYWFEITAEMPNIHWTLSLDAVGPASEIIRHGTDWNLISKNIHTMFDISPSVNIGTVITNLSLFQLKDLFEFVNDVKDRYNHRPNGRTQLISICYSPTYFSPYVWNEQLLPLAIEYINKLSRCPGLQSSQTHVLQSLRQGLSATMAQSDLWQQFIKYNSILDSVRDQQFLQLFPLHDDNKYGHKEQNNVRDNP